MHATSWMNAYSLIQWSIGDHQHQTMASSSIWHIAQNGMSHSNATVFSFISIFYFQFWGWFEENCRLKSREKVPIKSNAWVSSVYIADQHRLTNCHSKCICWYTFFLYCTALWSALTPLLLTTRTECAVRRENAVAFPSALVLLQFISKIKLIYNKCSRIQWESNYSVYYCVKNVLRGTAIFASKL